VTNIEIKSFRIQICAYSYENCFYIYQLVDMFMEFGALLYQVGKALLTRLCKTLSLESFMKKSSHIMILQCRQSGFGWV